MKTEAIIEIGNIQQQLNKGQEPLKTYLFNLIVYSPSKERNHDLKKILSRVTEKFPCRIIHIEKITLPDANEIKVKVSKEKLGKPGAQVACDIIDISVSESQLERLPFLILPNIVADLPVYLIWGEDPTVNTKTLSVLQNFSTRLIYNSTWAEHLQDFSLRMLPFLKTLKIDAMDISWGQLSAWKDLLAQVFDSPEKIQALQNCKKIKIGYRYVEPQDAIEAIYLQGFIASTMGWKLTAEEIQHDHHKALCYRYQDKDINVILDPVSDLEAKHGTILYFELIAQDGSIYSLNSRTPSKVVLHVSADKTCEMPCIFALPDINRGFNFLKEIFYQPPSDHYYHMLEIISQVNWEK
jgi:glucose-6-phosphate dehydrogenase assembly protein OpcA